ncbi:MAG: vWA domain-containing protein [Phycisphaerales bacterium]
MIRRTDRILPAACIVLAATAATAAHARPASCGGEACQRAMDQERAALDALAAARAKAGTVRTVEIAICLDTSGSMDGLIDAARARIWDIVNDLAKATPAPKLRVALLNYGNDGHNPEMGWTSIDTDFTEDLDMVSAKLFGLHTNGGTELVGRAIDRATRELKWTGDDTALKIMVIAGNESADQDRQVAYQEAAKRAIAAGILVNSVYCGAANDSLAPQWSEVARLADGRFACIDQSTGAVAIATPFDQELVALSASLNTTYLPFGAGGGAAWANQAAQDTNASGLNSAVAAQRCVTKGGNAYCNSGWDLVDASKDAAFKLEAVPADQLPEPMRAMTLEQRREHIAARAKEREEIRKRIAELDAQRGKFVAQETARRGADAGSFDRAIRDAVRAQAVARGLAFPPDAVAAAAPTP